MEHKSFWQYHKYIWSSALRTAWEKLGVLGAIVGFIAALLASILIRWANSRSDGSAEFIIVLTAAFFLVLCILALAIFASRESAIVYNKQVDQIDNLKGLAILPLDIRCFNYDPPKQTVGIEIHNPNLTELTYLGVELVSLIWIGEQDERWELTTNNKAFNFSLGEYVQQGTIPRDQTTRIYIAEVNQFNDIVFIPFQNYPFETDPTGVAKQYHEASFEIRLSVKGIINNKPIQQPYCTVVHFVGATVMPSTPPSLHIEAMQNEQIEMEPKTDGN